MAPRHGNKSASAISDAAAKERKVSKIVSSIVNVDKPIRLKRVIKAQNLKDACTLMVPNLGLTLLQIAVIADNVRAGAIRFILSADVAQQASRLP